MPKLTPAQMKALLAEKPVLASRQAAAKRLGVTTRSVDRAAQKGQLQVVKVGGRAMITNKSIDALIAAR
jgi:hypothetical protein